MTAPDYPVKRRRPNQPTNRRTRAARTQVLALIDWDAIHEMAASLPGGETGTVGRPPHFPPAAVLIFGGALWQLGGERAVERAFEEHRPLWHSVRRRLLLRYPGYPGLERHDLPMRRHHFRYYRDRYAIHPDVFEQLRADFRVQACALATSFGLFDPTKGSWTHPAVENLGVGDGTTLKPRLKAVPGDLQLDSDTGELVQRRYDPDAYVITTTDPETGEVKQGPRGISFGIVSASVPDVDNERVILDTYAIKPGEGNDEAALGIKSIGELAQLLPGAQGFVWDMAMRGRHKDAMYKPGLVPIVKTAKAPGGADKTALIGEMGLTSPDGTTTNVPVWAVNGALGMEVPVGGKTVFVEFERTKLVRRPGRWYGEYRVPDRAPAPARLRGATGRCRLDTTEEDRKRGLNRAEVLSAIPATDPDWEGVYIRNNAESVNALIKRKWWNDLAPAVGRPRQHFALLCAGLMINARSRFNHCERTETRGASPPERERNTAPIADRSSTPRPDAA